LVLRLADRINAFGLLEFPRSFETLLLLLHILDILVEGFVVHGGHRVLAHWLCMLGRPLWFVVAADWGEVGGQERTDQMWWFLEFDEVPATSWHWLFISI
jgi:hypothetical protein